MNREDWAFLERLIERALEVAPEEREAMLSEACGDRVHLLSQARKLVKAMVELDGFLEKPILECIADIADLQEPRMMAELESLPNYRILRKLGEGGMGQVFLVEQTGVERKVALKVIRAGFEEADLRSRFQTEYRVLARLEHEHIARIYDAGATPSGRPYFTMEYFPGIAVTRFADKHDLSVRQRISLFLKICEAVQHAHRKGIIHSDLKPSNILVRTVHGQPSVKVIDFGIARHQNKSTPKTTPPEARVWGTPCYMSPEQAARREIDTRTDIYGLGAVLYELLTGVPPFQPQQFHQKSSQEVLRMLVEEKPPPASARLGKEWHRFSVEPRDIQGDLDAITTKALAKDPEQRYSAVGALIGDLNNYLEDRPVSAARSTRTYLVGKFIKRHRTGVFAAAMIMVAMLLGTTFSVIGLIQAERATRKELAARAETEAKARELEAVVDIFEDMLSSPNPRLGSRDVKVIDVLAGAGTHLERYAGQPNILSRLHHTLGRTYAALGEHPTAKHHFHQALALRKTNFGDYHDDTLVTLERLATVYGQLGDYDQALAWYRQVRDATCPGDLRIQATRGLADLLRRLYAYGQALELFREVVREQMAAIGPHDRDRSVSMRGLGIVLDKLGQKEEASFYIQWALEIQMERFGVEDPDTLMTLNNYTNALFEEGLYAEAESLYRFMYDLREERLGTTHPDTLDSLHNLCRTLYHRRHYAEAVTVCSEAVDRRQGAAYKNLEIYKTMDILALAMEKLSREEGDPEIAKEAVTLLYHTLNDQIAIFGPNHPGTLVTATNLANIFLHMNRPAVAENILEPYLCSPQDSGRVETNDVLAWITLGEAQAAQGKVRACLAWFDTVSQFPEEWLPRNGPLWALCRSLLVSCLWGLPRF